MLIRFVVYAFITFLMIAWHEFGHAIMIINENFGIVNIRIKFSRKGLFTFPSMIHHRSTIENPNTQFILLGGVVATVILNPMINVILYIAFITFLPKEVIPNVLLLFAIPFVNLVEYFSSKKSSDLYILKSLYGYKTHVGSRLFLFRDILYTMKIIVYYCIEKNRYYSDESLSRLIPTKRYNHGIWLEDRIIVASQDSEENNKLKSTSIEKKDINLWFSINNKRTVKDMVDKFGLESLQILAKFREKNLIKLYCNNPPSSEGTFRWAFKKDIK